MSQKHYLLFANMLANIPSAAMRLKFAEEIIPILKMDNENFKEGKFRSAANCEVDGNGYYVHKRA